MGLFARLSTLIGVLVIAASGAIGYAVYVSLAAEVRPRELDGALDRTRARLDDIDRAVRGFRTQLQLLRGSGELDDLLREPGPTSSETLESSREAAKDRLATRFVRALEVLPDAIQIRLIGDADGGMEVVRVDRAPDGTEITRTPEDELQQKGARPYFVATLPLGEGEVFVSAIELNQEQGRVETPRLPVLRFATPVFDSRGARFGALVLNVDMRPSLERLRGRAGSEAYLAADRGDYLVHPDRDREFGADLGRSDSWRSDFPEVAAALADKDALVVGERSAEPLVAVRARIAGGPEVTVIERLDSSMRAATPGLWRSSLAMALLAAAVALAAALWVARSLTRPLDQLASAIGRFEGAPPSDLPLDSPPEIGAVVRAFEGMARAVARQWEDLRVTGTRERLHIAMVQSSEEAIVTTDLDGKITATNPAADEMYAAPSTEPGEELAGAPIASLGITLPSGGWDELLRSIAAGESVPPFDAELARPDRSVELEVTLSRIRDAAGTVVGMSILARDVGNRRRLERQLAQIVEASTHGMALVDGGGRIRVINRAMCEMFGYSSDSLVGRSVDILVPESERERHAEYRAAFLHNPVARPMGQGRDLRAVCRNGRALPVEVALSPFRDPSGEEAVLVTVVDITERKRAEVQLAAYSERLAESNEDLAQFASVVSQDVRAPIRGIGLLADAMVKALERRHLRELGEHISELRARTAGLESIIEGILSYSTIGQSDGPPPEIDTRRLVEDVLSELDVPDSIAISVSGVWPRVRYDPTELRQVFSHLVQNAIQHGRTTRQIELSCKRGETDLWFHVEDDGVGIPDIDHERVFRLLDRSGSPGSAGIGLALVKRIVERNDGHVRLRSRDDGGLDVRFSMPNEAALDAETP